MTNYPIDIESFARYSNGNAMPLRTGGAFRWLNGATGLSNNGPYGEVCATPGNYNTLTAQFYSNYSTIYLGCYMNKVDNNPLTFVDTNTGDTLLTLAYDLTNLRVLAYLGNSNTLLAASSNGTIPQASGWHFLEIGVGINSSTGFFIVKVNGTAIINETNVNTVYNVGVTTVNQITLLPLGGNIADLYFATSGFCGEGRALHLPVTANGSTIQFSSSTANPNYENIDGGTQQTNYNYSSTVGNIDVFEVDTSSIAAGSSILGVSTSVFAWKDNTDTRTIETVVTQSSNTTTGTNQTLIPTAESYQDFYQTNPNTSAPWTIADLGAAQFGYKVAS